MSGQKWHSVWPFALLICQDRNIAFIAFTPLYFSVYCNSVWWINLQINTTRWIVRYINANIYADKGDNDFAMTLLWIFRFFLLITMRDCHVISIALNMKIISIVLWLYWSFDECFFSAKSCSAFKSNMITSFWIDRFSWKFDVRSRESIQGTSWLTNWKFKFWDSCWWGTWYTKQWRCVLIGNFSGTMKPTASQVQALFFVFILGHIWLRFFLSHLVSLVDDYLPLLAMSGREFFSHVCSGKQVCD